MLSPALFEKLDQIARYCRGNAQPFGGIQIVVCGDFFQLPPVEKVQGCRKCGNELKHPASVPEDFLAAPLYGETSWLRCTTPHCHFIQNNNITYAFETTTWAELDFTNIMLTKIFRQNDPLFIACLNRVRLGTCSAEDEALLRGCERPLGKVICPEDVAATRQQTIKPTKLYPRKQSAETENEGELRRLADKDSHLFLAKDEVLEDNKISKTNRQVPKNFQASEKLELKVGCQVMLLVNRSFGQQLVNGSRGVVIDFVDCREAIEKTKSQLKDNNLEHESLAGWQSRNFEASGGAQCMLPYVLFASGHCAVIAPHSFDNRLDAVTRARRTQLPLSLAWGESAPSC